MNKYPNLNNKRWQVYEGGNFVLVVTAEFEKWNDENHVIGGPYLVCQIAYPFVNRYRERIQRRAVSMARRIVADHNTILDFTQQMVVKVSRSDGRDYWRG